MGRKRYVGNLSYDVSSSDLETLFAAFGSVQSAEVIADRETGRSKGFGFVEMGSDEAAQAAIQGLNGQEHDGRALKVNELVRRSLGKSVVVDADRVVVVTAGDVAGATDSFVAAWAANSTTTEGHRR